MKKALIITTAFLIAVVSLVSAFITSTPQRTQQVSAMSFTEIVATSDIKPLATEGGPWDVVNTPIYSRTSKGVERQIYVSSEFGLLMSSDFEPIADVSGANTLVTLYDSKTSNFFNSREQTLAIYLDSRLNRHYLTGGGSSVTHINLDREIFLINFKPSDGQERLIYCFRSERKLSWWDDLWTAGKVYDYFDMNGMKIQDKYITNMKAAKWWQIALSIGTLGIAGLFDNVGLKSQYADIKERTTLGELRAYMYEAIHPWQKVNAITMDGYDVYINPRTKQLTDFYGFAIWNAANGLPIIYWQDNIYTTDGQQQIITSGIMRDAFTVNALLGNGTNFSIGTTVTIFGTYDVPMFNPNGDIYNPDWTLLNGDSADGVIIDNTYYAESVKGATFGEWLSGLFGDLFGTLGNWALLVVVIILLIFCFPLVIQLAQVLFTIVLAPFKWLAKKLGN